MILESVQDTLLLLEPLPYNLAAETALQPLIWCWRSVFVHRQRYRVIVAQQTPTKQAPTNNMFYETIRDWMENRVVFLALSSSQNISEMCLFCSVGACRAIILYGHHVILETPDRTPDPN